MRVARVVRVRAVLDLGNNVQTLASQGAAQKANKFGISGAGGSSNEGNFTSAWRTSIAEASAVEFPDWLSARVETLIQKVPFKPNRDGSNPMLKLRDIVWDVAEWLVNDFGASPATACQGIFSRAAFLVLARLHARHTSTDSSPPWVGYQEQLTKTLGSRVSAFRRGGGKGVRVEISMDEGLMKSPMKMLIADGKVISVSRGVRGQIGTRTGPQGTREMFTVVVSRGSPAPTMASNPDGHLFGEEDFTLDESDDEDENEALVSPCLPVPACLPADHAHT